jgi:hypothetical protein
MKLRPQKKNCRDKLMGYCENNKSVLTHSEKVTKLTSALVEDRNAV